MNLRLWLIAPAAALLAAYLSASGLGAQALPFLLFERYLDPLRIQAGIPGLSAVILQDDQIIWERGLGTRDIEANLPATPDTPYAIADLTQTITATLIMHCAERGAINLRDPIGSFLPTAESPETTLRQLMSHAAPGSALGYRYTPSRFGLLARPVETCFDGPFRHVVARNVFDLLSMRDAVPGYDILTAPGARERFDAATLGRYEALLERVATPYRVDNRGRATRGDLPPVAVDGSHGLIASARDLAKFDQGLTIHLRPESLALAWTNVAHNGVATPFGLGWFVQNYNGEKLVWHYGHFPQAFSSLILKVPERRLTLILLANSDGLSGPFSLNEGDVTSSLFARIFLRLFL